MTKVSIIIPCYNQEKYIADSLNSALLQTYKDIEIVCINDGSTDNSGKIIKSFAEKYKNIKFIDNEKNNGIIYARNAAIDASTGEYILPLDSDDTIESTYVEKAVKILDANSNIGIVYCRARMFGDIEEEWALDDFDKSEILYKNSIFVTALFRKSDFIKAGKYKDYMNLGCEDYDLWLSFLELGLDAYRIDEVLFNYRQHGKTSRTNICRKNEDSVWKTMIKHHIDLYLADKQFLDRLIYTDIKRFQKKYQKYKKLFNIILFILIAESLLLIVFIAIFLINWTIKPMF